MAAEQVPQMIEVPLDLLDDSPYQPRVDYVEEELQELAQNIGANGVLAPLTVRPVNERYELIGGHRRSRAARLAGLKSVPCVVHDVDDLQAQRMALLDNLARVDLQPWEEGAAYQNLMDAANMNIAEVAAAVAKSKSVVRSRIELSEGAGEALRAAYLRGDLNLEAMQAGAKFPDEIAEVKECMGCSAVCPGGADRCAACGLDISATFAFPVGNPQEVAAKALNGVPTWGVSAVIGKIRDSYGLADRPVQASMGLYGVEVERLSDIAVAAKTKLDRLCEQVAKLEGWWLQNEDCLAEYSRDQLESIAAKCRVTGRVVERVLDAVDAQLAEAKPE